MKTPHLQIIENTAIGVTLGALPIITGFLAGWWLSIPFVPEARIFQCALAGLLLGVLIDVIFLRKWIRNAYSLKAWVWMAVYAFYSIGLFGFFMGVPVFNLLLAVPTGVFVGRWLAHSDSGPIQMHKAVRQTALFTTSVLGAVCIASAWIALSDPFTANNLNGILGLPFRVTLPLILGIIFGGGALILGIEWWLTTKSVEHAYGYFITHAASPST